MGSLWAKPTWYEVAGVTALAVWTVTLADTADRVLLATSLGVVSALALLLRRTAPLLPMPVVLVGMLASASVAGRPSPDDPYLLMLIWASYSAGRHASPRYQPWVAFNVLVFVALTAPDAKTASDVVFPFIFAGVPWLAGLALQLADRRAHRAEVKADALTSEMLTVAGRAEVDERLRIARELHDVMGHTLTGLSLQLQALRRRAAGGRQVTELDLLVVESTTTELLGDVRRLVGLLKSDADAARRPLPGVDDLESLVQSGARHGQRVQLTMTGEPRPLPPTLSTAIFRICQESLANAAHHGGDGLVSVQVDWTTESLSLAVQNPLQHAGASNGAAPLVHGHGLAGMRERAELLGGSFRATRDVSLWTVSVDIPTPALPVVS